MPFVTSNTYIGKTDKLYINIYSSFVTMNITNEEGLDQNTTLFFDSVEHVEDFLTNALKQVKEAKQ